MVRNWKGALLNWLLAYWVATVILVLVTIGLAVALHLPSAKELGVSMGQAPSWFASFPYQPPVNLVVWLLFAWAYLRRFDRSVVMREAVQLTLLWGVISAVADFLFWVVIPTPLQLSFHDFYYVYGPTLAAIYSCIVLSPVVVGYLLARKAERTAA